MYIVMYAVLSSVLGNWVDKQIKAKISAREVLKYVGGVQFTILCVLVLAASCIPRGALSFNPQLIEGHHSNEEVDGEFSSTMVQHESRTDLKSIRR